MPGSLFLACVPYSSSRACPLFPAPFSAQAMTVETAANAPA